MRRETVKTCLDSDAWKARVAAKKLLAEELAKRKARRGEDEHHDDTEAFASGAQPA